MQQLQNELTVKSSMVRFRDNSKKRLKGVGATKRALHHNATSSFWGVDPNKQRLEARVAELEGLIAQYQAATPPAPHGNYREAESGANTKRNTEQDEGVLATFATESKLPAVRTCSPNSEKTEFDVARFTKGTDDNVLEHLRAEHEEQTKSLQEEIATLRRTLAERDEEISSLRENQTNAASRHQVELAQLREQQFQVTEERDAAFADAGDKENQIRSLNSDIKQIRMDMDTLVADSQDKENLIQSLNNNLNQLKDERQEILQKTSRCLVKVLEKADFAISQPLKSSFEACSSPSIYFQNLVELTQVLQNLRRSSPPRKRSKSTADTSQPRKRSKTKVDGSFSTPNCRRRTGTKKIPPLPPICAQKRRMSPRKHKNSKIVYIGNTLKLRNGNEPVLQIESGDDDSTKSTEY